MQKIKGRSPKKNGGDAWRPRGSKGADDEAQMQNVKGGMKNSKRRIRRRIGAASKPGKGRFLITETRRCRGKHVAVANTSPWQTRRRGRYGSAEADTASPRQTP